MSETELWVPVERLDPILAHSDMRRSTMSQSAQRLMWSITNRDRTFLRLSTVDKLLIELDLDIYLHLPREQDGLADIYEDGTQYGNPSRLAA